MSITISDTTPRVQYTAANTQTAFAVPFEFFTNADLKVYAGSSLLTYAATPANAAQYSVSGAGVSGGGSITIGAASTNGVIYTIYRDMAVARSTDFPTSGAFQIGSLNTELDKVVAMIQQVERDLSFSPQAAATTANTFNLTFPDLVADKILSVNSAGTALEFLNTTTNVSAVSGKITEIGLLGTSANITAMGLLGTSAVVTDLGILGTTAIVEDLSILATTDVVADMAILATSDVVNDMNVLGTSAIVTDMDLLGTSANVTAMGLLGVSGVITDMGILGTTAIVADMAILGTTDVVADMAILATSDVVTDMNVLATSDVVTDMNVLGTSDVVTDMNVLGTSANVTAMNTLGTSANVTAMSTVAANVAGVNSFADRYRITSGDPGDSLNAGDLNYNTSSNAVKYYNGSSWVSITAPEVSLAGTETLTNKTLTSPKINENVAVTSTATELNLLDGKAATNLALIGKTAGTNFTNSLLVGHATTGTLSSAEGNTGIGIATLNAVTSGVHNTAIGYEASGNLTGGGSNTNIGRYAGNSNQTASHNTSIGYDALRRATGGNNTSIGSFSGDNINSGVNNITVGKQAGDNITSGDGNVIIGSINADSATADKQLIIADGVNGSVAWLKGDSNGQVKLISGYVLEVALTDATTVTWNAATQPVAKVTLAGNRTFALPTNPVAGQFISILLIQDGTGGRTITWNAAYEFAADTAPTLTATASLGDLFTFRYNGAKWLEVGRNLALTLS